jgi:hypothetical protein
MRKEQHMGMQGIKIFFSIQRVLIGAMLSWRFLAHSAYNTTFEEDLYTEDMILSGCDTRTLTQR